MNNRNFGFKEQDIMNNFAESLKETVAAAEPSFRQAIPSAIDHSVNLLKTDNLPTFDELGNIRSDVIHQNENQAVSVNNHGQGQSNSKEKVRVRSIGGLSPYGTPISNQASDVNDNYSNMSMGYSNNDNPNVWRTGGYTETMILIGTAFLVLLVFMVSYLMLNYFG